MHMITLIFFNVQVRTPHNSTKMNNVRILYGNSVFRELLEVELTDKAHKFKLHALITNPNCTNKKMVLLLFINNRLVESSCKFHYIKTDYFYLYNSSFIVILFQQSVKC